MDKGGETADTRSLSCLCSLHPDTLGGLQTSLHVILGVLVFAGTQWSLGLETGSVQSEHMGGPKLNDYLLVVTL
jgi:hypothetical protein